MAKTKESEKDGLQKLIDELNSKFGKGTVISSKNKNEHVEVIPTGSFSLDLATNIGGVPVGKLIEMFGPESSGKSTMTLHMIAEHQKRGKRCMLVDSEHSFDNKYAQNIGVNTEELLYASPECLEDAWNLMEKVVKSGQVQFIVFDSHTSSLPKKVIDGEVGEATMALQARLNSTALGKIHPLLDIHKVTLLAISQTRMNIGGYGNPEVTTGGQGWKFYSDMRFKVSKQLDKTNDQNKTTVEVIKNKCAVPFGKAEFMVRWGVGVDRQQEIIDYAVEFGFIKLGGSWYTLEDDVKIQGDTNLKLFMESNPEWTEKLEKKVLEKLTKIEL